MGNIGSFLFPWPFHPQVPSPYSRSWRMNAPLFFTSHPSLRRLWSLAILLLLGTAPGCGGVGVTGSGGGGGGGEQNLGLNLDTPYDEIQLSVPSNLPAPGLGEGAGGVSTGAGFASAIGGANVTAVLQRGIFNPNWTQSSNPNSARLAWATYWLDMTDVTEATTLVLSWLEAPQTEYVWVGLSNWDENRWTWLKLNASGTLPPPDSLNPFIRDVDSMLACTILVAGATNAILDGLRTDQDAPPPPVALLNENAHLGINLEAITDYSPSVEFVDVFQTARNWIPQDLVGGPWDNGNTVNVDSNGWVTSLDPGQAVATLMMVDAAGVHPSGQYICLYDGEGTIEFKAEGSIAWSTPGRMGVDINNGPGSFVLMRITSTNPANYLRNIRLIMPGYESTYQSQVFSPEFLSSLSPFKVLRFTKWGATVTSTVETWANRTTLQSFTQARQRGPSAGASLELMIDLSNANLSDAWICIPHLADNDYVLNAATLIRDRLDRRLRVYVEYSNEIWNNQFIASTYCRDQGLALGLSGNNFEAQLRFSSQRSQEIHSIFSEIFVDQPDRLVRVIAGQAANPWVGATVMDWDAAQGLEDAGTVAERFDTYAVAPYFGGYLGNLPQANTTVNMTVSELLDACDLDSLSNNGPGSATEANQLNTTNRGITLIAYEGGQHLVGVGAALNNVDLTNLFIAANRDPALRDIYANDLRRWTTSGGGLFVTFHNAGGYTKFGSWGIVESQGQDPNTAPKWLGLMDWLAEISAAD
jgi:hypothetical protein